MKKKTFSRELAFEKRCERERNVLADVMRRNEVIVRGSAERGNEKCDGLLPPLSRNVCARVCLCHGDVQQVKETEEGWYR